jgi:hypothetical protein
LGFDCFFDGLGFVLISALPSVPISVGHFASLQLE